MTTQEGSQLHHVVFAVTPERHDAVAQMFVDLGFVLQPAELRRTAVRLMAYASNRTYKEQGSYSTGDRR
jgi:hypothetical protein